MGKARATPLRLSWLRAGLAQYRRSRLTSNVGETTEWLADAASAAADAANSVAKRVERSANRVSANAAAAADAAKDVSGAAAQQVHKIGEQRSAAAESAKAAVAGAAESASDFVSEAAESAADLADDVAEKTRALYTATADTASRLAGEVTGRLKRGGKALVERRDVGAIGALVEFVKRHPVALSAVGLVLLLLLLVRAARR